MNLAQKTFKIADVHAHVFPEKLAVKAAGSIGAFYGTEMYCEASMEKLLEEEGKAGVSRYVISSSAVTPKQVSHILEFLSQARLGHPECIAFGSIYPGMDGFEDVLDELQSLGLRGLKIHPDFQKLPIDDESCIGTYRSIARRGLPVLMHMGDNRYDFSSPERLTNLIRRVPDLVVIAAHFGGWNAWDQSLRHPQPENVFYDTSSTTPMIPYDMVMRLFDALGPERFLFGTDFPMWSPSEMVWQFMQYDLGDSLREQILYGNFMKLFGLTDEPEKGEGTHV